MCLFGSAQRKDARRGFGEALNGGGALRIGKKGEVEDTAGASQDSAWERGLIGKDI